MARKRKQKSKLTENQKEYRKQMRRITHAAHEQERRGYITDEFNRWFEEKFQTPKRITKSFLNRLKQVKPKTIRGKSEYISRRTGEMIPGREAEKIERYERKNIPQASDIIDRFFSDMEIVTSGNTELMDMIRDHIDANIFKYGEDSVAESLQKALRDNKIPEPGIPPSAAVQYINGLVASLVSYLELDESEQKRFMSGMENGYEFEAEDSG